MTHERVVYPLRLREMNPIPPGGCRRRETSAPGRGCTQRFDSALRLNPHLHTIALDEVYVRRPEGLLRFHPLPAPTAVENA